MSKFLTDLKVELVNQSSHSGRGEWRLTQPLIYQSDNPNIQTLTVPEGFITDFASVPRVPIAFWLAGDTATEPSVLHDYLYKITPHICSREEADDLLYHASTETGVPKWRAWIMLLGVRMFGWMFWK